MPIAWGGGPRNSVEKAYFASSLEDQVPGNKSEAATPAPPAQQNAPPDKVAPGPLNSPNAVPPDAKTEANAPALKMDSGAEKKLPASEDATSGQDTTRQRP